MLDISAEALAVLRGSFVPVVQVDAWYDGQLILQGVPWTSGSLTDDVSRATLSTGSTTAASPDNSLIPTSWAAPLACYGSELHIRTGIDIAGRDTEWFSLGWYVIDDFDCADWWQPYPLADGSEAWAARGTQVQNELSDRWELIDQATFAVPEQPVQLTSALTEIARLADGIVPVSDLSGVTDVAIPTTITYSSRTTAMQDLAGLVGMQARMSRDGELTLVPLQPSGGAVWTVTVESGDVARILAYGRKGDRSGLYNQFVSTGTSPGGTPVQGVATTDSGPLRFGGPLGQIPLVNDGPLLTTIVACAADARVQQQTQGGGQTVLLPVTVPANPALEAGDVIGVVLPDLTLTGPVASIARTLGQSTMDVNVQISREALWGATA